MRNFPIKHEGKTFWVSPSVATCVFIYKWEGDNLNVLITKRGKGAANHQGEYCCPCGYYDYADIPKGGLEYCAAREVFEETGFECVMEDLFMVNVCSGPQAGDDNVGVHYVYMADDYEDFNTLVAKGGEKDEVAEVAWLMLGKKVEGDMEMETIELNPKSKKMLDEKFCFNHGKRIIEYLSKYYNVKKQSK